jgi:hypothetical protein
MFLKASLALPQASGFVAFDGHGTAEPVVRRRAPKRVDVAVTPRLDVEPVPAVALAHDWHGSSTWQPSTGAAVRRVEAAVLVGICAYFAFGLAGVAGWL